MHQCLYPHGTYGNSSFSMYENKLQSFSSRRAAWLFRVIQAMSRADLYPWKWHEKRIRLCVCRKWRVPRALHCKEMRARKHATAYNYDRPRSTQNTMMVEERSKWNELLRCWKLKNSDWMGYGRYYKTFPGVFNFCLRCAMKVYKKNEFWKISVPNKRSVAKTVSNVFRKNDIKILKNQI